MKLYNVGNGDSEAVDYNVDKGIIQGLNYDTNKRRKGKLRETLSLLCL